MERQRENEKKKEKNVSCFETTNKVGPVYFVFVSCTYFVSQSGHGNQDTHGQSELPVVETVSGHEATVLAHLGWSGERSGEGRGEKIDNKK
jgi:hypothetical protein